jgi:hypothetical protein
VPAPKKCVNAVSEVHNQPLVNKPHRNTPCFAKKTVWTLFFGKQDPTERAQLLISPNCVLDASLVPETCLESSALPV